MAYASFCLFNCVFVFVKLSVTLVTFELTSFCYFSLCYIILLNYFLFNLFLFLQKSGGAKSPPPSPSLYAVPGHWNTRLFCSDSKQAHYELGHTNTACNTKDV